MKRLISVISQIYGIGVALVLLMGGLSFFGYVAAFCIGGETATAICVFIYKTLYPILFYSASGIALLGLLKMYLAGEKSMVPGNKYKK